MWTVLICDEDDFFLQEMEREVIGAAVDGVKNVELFSEKEKLEFYIMDHPGESGIVMLDIRLGGKSGIPLAKKVLQYQPNSQIIFMSGYDGYFPEVYEVDHVYFLRKPVDEEHLRKALSKAGKRLQDLEAGTLVIANRNGTYHIPFREILFFENEKRQIHVHTIKGTLSYYGKFDDLMSKLDKRFMRCHNSYIVNIARARVLRNKKFYFDTDQIVPVSRSYYSGVLAYFGKD